ncbi:MAG: DUF1329 domain-containing protein [Pseudomonadales bacterium]|nr:DUF1329 domain-containing protein [Pseudomonadales bacterium]
MKTIHRVLGQFVLPAVLLTVPAFAQAKISKDEAKKLGSSLTPMGANPAANADGSIPAWTGSILGVPEGVTYVKSGDVYPDLYASEKPLFTITKANMAKYEDKLTDGAIALLNKYPDSYKLVIYPSHRDFRYSEEMEQRTAWNVGNSELVGSIDGLQKFTGSVPFPLPENGAEIIWNARMNQPMPVADSLFDEIAVYPDGNMQRFRSKLMVESPYSYGEHAIGAVAEDLGDIAAFVFYEVVEPKRKKGEMVVVHEPVDQFKHERKAWVYIPGAKRVKRAPNVGYDTPIGPGGLMTADDSMGFNGAMDRYEWKLIGKEEKFVPYNSYRFDDPKVKYEELLTGKHVNPDYMRYELHRVWVVEATLKEGKRHVYGKRRFYMDEDSWLIVSTDSYDGRGDLWRVGLNNTVYDYYLKGFIARAQINYDLQSGAYIAMRAVNETRPTDYAAKTKGAKFYTPNSLRKMGRR